MSAALPNLIMCAVRERSMSGDGAASPICGVKPPCKRRKRWRPLKHQPCIYHDSDGPITCAHRAPIITTFVRSDRNWRRQAACKYVLFVLHILGSTASTFARPFSTTAFIASSSTSTTRHHHHTFSISNNRASLCVPLHHPPAIGGVRKMNGIIMTNSFKGPAHNANDDDASQLPSALQPNELLQKLTSFSSNISRLRTARKKYMASKRCGSKDEMKANGDALIGACTSLDYFLRDETERLSPTDTLVLDLDEATTESMREMLEMVLIQSIRASSEVGDFVLLLKLVHAAVDYATAIANNSSTNVATLAPRIFGEAITSLGKTKASLSKIKSLWNFFVHDVATSENQILSSPPSSYELNAMLASLRDRNRVSAAMKLYRGTQIKGDAYTASILFGMLADSVPNDGFAWNHRNKRDGGALDETKSTDEGMYISPCWQWNEAMELLDTFSPSQLNNYAYAAILKVNERATEEYNTDTRHDGVKCAMSVLKRMKRDGISPDVVTCSTIMSTFDKGRNWNAAVTLLNVMRAASSQTTTYTNKKWSLPSPNTYTYSLVISICARCNQGEVALSLLDRMAKEVTKSNAEPNTWVYNAALLACAKANNHASNGSKSSISSAHLATAFDILEKMENGSNAASPDTVSYNTVLSAINESSFAAVKEESLSSEKKEVNKRLSKHDRIVDVMTDILDSMKARGVSRDAITYHNAIVACGSNSEDALAILRKALEDTDFMLRISTDNNIKGRAATGVIFVANAALSVAAASGDIHAVSAILSLLMQINNSKLLNAESMKHIIQTLGKIDDCEAILALLVCLRGQSTANDILNHRYSIDILSNISEHSIPMVEEEVYSTAITSCLRHDELGMADHILLSMKNSGLTVNRRSLMEIISEYCRMAMASSKEEFKIARLAKKQGLESDSSRFGILEPIYITSRARAKAALAMLKAVEKPVPPSLLSPVAKACCAAGLWQDARSILRRMHRAAINELRQQQQTGSDDDRRVRGRYLDELPRLHRSLLKFCAKGGNITPALNFADDIQFLASRIRHHGKKLRVGEEEPMITLSSRLLMDIPMSDNIPESDFSNAGALSSTVLERRPIGLRGQDWKLILIAASRGGHWKVCVSTLAFLRPYVKETHPRYARESLLASSPSDSGSGSGSTSTNRPSLERLNRKYERIARALTAAILCFEARSQYAWAIRCIDDWIEWSGRRPRKEAVASACRVLAKRYRGQEVLTLVSKVIAISPTDDTKTNDDGDDSQELNEYPYEKAVYTEAINALHKSGLYEEADQLYAEGVANGHLPWAVMQQGDGTEGKRLRLDLHGMSAAVAHSAVRVSLQKEIVRLQSTSSEARANDAMIITGRGRRSGERFRPVLRPEVQRMLTEEFYPPLGSSSIPGNMGALLVSSDDIQAWLNHQQQQKGERLMFVADVLRDISSVRIEKALLSSGNRLERALMKFKSENDDADAGESD